jgi:threonine dehydratase
VAGAGTLGVEIDADAGVPDRVLVSVGGGGLVAGLAAWYAGRCRIDALEPSRAPTLHAARAAGAPVDVEVGGVAADSLGARRIGAIAWALQAQVQGAHLLDDEAITRARQRMWAELRLAVEPAAALPLAALWEGMVRPAPQERVAVIVCGANTDPATLEA